MEAPPATPILIDLEPSLEPETDEVIHIPSDETSFKKKAEAKKDNANQFYKEKLYDKALPLYTEAITLSERFPNASYYGNRAACYMMLNQHMEALVDVKKALEIDPKYVKGYLRMAKCYIAMGDLVAAHQALMKVEELEPSNLQLALEKRNYEFVKNQIEYAEKSIEKKEFRNVLFAKLPNCPRFNLMKAECLTLLGKHTEAQAIADDILRADSRNVDAILVRGMSLYYEDNIDKAFTHFQFVLKAAPDHKKALEIYKRARALKQTKEEGNAAFACGDLQKAFDIYSQALQIDPLNTKTNAKLYFNRATVCAKMNKLQEAVSDCSAALELDNNYLKALLRRAKCYTDLNMFEEAVADYEKVHRLERNGEHARLLQAAKLALKRSKRKDYYKVLGIDKTASDADIKKAYKKRALEHHPDRHSDASDSEKVEQEKRFKEVGEAYAILSDPKKRARYDNGQDLEDMEGMTSRWPGGFNGTYFGMPDGFPGFEGGYYTYRFN